MGSKNEKSRIIPIILSMSLVLTIIGITYAAFQYSKDGTKANTVETGQVNFVYTEESNGIEITNALPMSDDQGKLIQQSDTNISNGYFDFNVESSLGNSMEIQYYIYAVDVTGDVENKLNPKYVKIYLTDQSTPEKAYDGYDEVVPVYSYLDDVTATDGDGQEVKGKLLYQNKFIDSGKHLYRLRLWVSSDYENPDIARSFKMRVDVSTDVQITPVEKDSEKPTCEVLSAEPKNANRDEDITINLKCTDNKGIVTSDMTDKNVHVKINGEEVTPTKKQLSEGIATTKVTGDNGVQHTLTLSGFEEEGKLSLSIDKGVIKDDWGNTNDEINLDTEVNIGDKPRITLVKGEGVESIEPDQEYLECELNDQESCEVTLPEITAKEGYDEGYWTTDESSTEGVTGTISVSKSATYYAKANDITAPVCKLVSTDPTTGNVVEYNKTLKMVVDCTDNSGSISNDLTKDFIKLKYGEMEGTADITVSDARDIENGKEYDISLTNFSGDGLLVPIILADAVKDASDIGNIETAITTDITIKGPCSAAVDTISGLKYNSYDKSNYNNGCDESSKHNMYKIKQNSTQQKSATTDYRYIGNDPYNYVNLLGTEEGKKDENLWRIIGVFDDPSALEKGDIGSRKIKLMKYTSIGDYSIDNTGSSGNKFWGRPSALNEALNNLFYNSTSGQCPYGSSGKTTSCDFTSSGLKNVQDKIENMKWYLGDTTNPITFEHPVYDEERSNALVNDYVPNTTGYVGLPYASDYVNTFALGVNATCFGTTSTSMCSKTHALNSWMYNNDYWWFITTTSFTNSPNWFLSTKGNISANKPTLDSVGVNPVVYLSSKYEITDGTGTKDDPYTVSVVEDKDTVLPVCSIESITPKIPTQEDNLQVKIKCSDDKSEVQSTLSIDDIEVKINGEATTTTKEISSQQNITNGIEYTIALSNFDKEGLLSIRIPERKITDASGNGNFATTFSLVSILNVNNGTKFIRDHTNEPDATWDTGDHNKMFVFAHGKTYQLEDTTDYRYVGDDPNNYIDLTGGNASNEGNLWRIIGVTKEANSTGKLEYRLKLIRANDIGNFSWDNVNEPTGYSSYYGANSWERPSALKTILNGAFLNSQSNEQCPFCSDSEPYCQDSPTIPCDFSGSGLENVKDKIENMTWYLGGGSLYSSDGNLGAEAFYKTERGSDKSSYKGASIKGTGQVGLMYPSDYGFAYGAGFGKTICYQYGLDKCDKESTKNWLFNQDKTTWTITPGSTSSDSLFIISWDGQVHTGSDAFRHYYVLPVVYLKSSIEITGGSGTIDSPYIIS